jgi:hypothetical protein
VGAANVRTGEMRYFDSRDTQLNAKHVIASQSTDPWSFPRGMHVDRDRGTPRGATPPTPPGIRVTYHGGSTGLGVDRDIESGETDRVEVAVGQCLLNRWVS